MNLLGQAGQSDEETTNEGSSYVAGSVRWLALRWGDEAMRTEPEAFDVLPDGSGERTVVLGTWPSDECCPVCGMDCSMSPEGPCDQAVREECCDACGVKAHLTIVEEEYGSLARLCPGCMPVARFECEDMPLCDLCGDETGELEVTLGDKVYWACSDCAEKYKDQATACCDVCGGEDNVKPRVVDMLLCGECGTRVERVERLLKAMKGGA